MIAMCGLVCTDCPAYIAAQKNDDKERKRVAKVWSTDEVHLEPEDVNCAGCLADSERIIKFSRNCEVRLCGFVKNVENCAYCEEYPCEKLNKIHEKSPEANVTLDEIRGNHRT